MTKTVLINREVVERAALLIQSQLGSPATVADLRASLESAERWTPEELAAASERADKLAPWFLKNAPAQAGKPVAWLHEDGVRIVTAAQKHTMENHNGAPGKHSAAGYCVPLAHLTGAASQERNAQRYEWLRSKHWSDGKDMLTVTTAVAIKVGYQTYSRDLLDAAIDAAMQSTPPAPRSAE